MTNLKTLRERIGKTGKEMAEYLQRSVYEWDLFESGKKALSELQRKQLALLFNVPWYEIQPLDKSGQLLHITDEY